MFCLLVSTPFSFHFRWYFILLSIFFNFYYLINHFLYTAHCIASSTKSRKNVFCVPRKDMTSCAQGRPNLLVTIRTWTTLFNIWFFERFVRINWKKYKLHAIREELSLYDFSYILSINYIYYLKIHCCFVRSLSYFLVFRNSYSKVFRAMFESNLIFKNPILETGLWKNWFMMFETNIIFINWF